VEARKHGDVAGAKTQTCFFLLLIFVLLLVLLGPYLNKEGTKEQKKGLPNSTPKASTKAEHSSSSSHYTGRGASGLPSRRRGGASAGEGP